MKKLFIALGLIATFGLLGTLENKNAYVVNAEDSNEISLVESQETSIEESDEESIEKSGSLESIEITSQDISEAETIYENIKSGASEVLDVIVGVLEQPIVIAGVSTTFGVLLILAFSKFFSVLSKKKVIECLHQISELNMKIDNSITKEEYDKAIEQTKALYNVVKLLVDSTKNINVKAKAKTLLVELEPVFNEQKVFIEEQKQVVVEKVGEVSKHIDNSAKHIMDIVNKD